MSSLFDSLITAKLDGTRFAFYTDDEIEKLSVKEINNPMAYDELGNPTPGGICDEAMGVSALDKLSMCKTCGCDTAYCPGHMGHIKLTSTCYNPFSIKLLQKLLKSKCLSCHRLRIYPNRMELYKLRIKLINLGFMTEAAKLGEYADFGLSSIDASINILRKKLSSKTLNKESVDADGAPTNKEKDETLTALEKLSEREKEEREIFFTYITSIFEDNKARHVASTASSIAMRKLVKEIMLSIIPSQCPHCKARNPRIRKEGATKFFQMPLSNKDLKAMKGEHARIDALTIGMLSDIEEDEDDERDNEIYEDPKDGTAEDKPEKKQKFLDPIVVREHMRRLWHEDGSLLTPLFGSHMIFFLNNLLVTPNRFRPESSGGKQAGDDREYLHAHSAMLTTVLKCNKALRRAIELKENLGQEEDAKERADTASERSKAHSTEISHKEVTPKEVIKCWIDLQEGINCYLDSSLASKTENKEKPGLRQLLERKEGLFRMKMMGKRVDQAGRSVISPDPYISTDQIGVPEFIARTLTFPEGARNLEKLRKCVINGAHKHPGANFIVYPNGEKKSLENMTLEERKAEAALLNSGGKIVYRHLETGDPLLTNRQPTLHKPSIMAHIARVLPKEQTLRMHYSNCKAYNADFDGDEINIHLPQNYTAIAEAYELAATHRQYIVPTSGFPIRGLIQDFVVSSVYLTCKDTFLTKELYNQLVYSALSEFLDSKVINKIHLEIPAFLKTVQGPIWTGKQVITTILKNLSFDDRDFIDQYRNETLKVGLNLTSKTRLNNTNWGILGHEEGEVIIRNSELLQGIIDKNNIGDKEFGMIHSFYEVYGSKRAGQLLTALGRVLVTHLQHHGFTCGLDDTLLTKESNQDRQNIIKKAHKKGIQAGAQFCGIKIDYGQGNGDKDGNNSDAELNNIDEREEKRIIQEIKVSIEKRFVNEGLHIEKEFDTVVQNEMNDATSKINDTCLPSGLIKLFPKNNMNAMVLTGAKGGKVNRSQISCLLGQQELEGKRVPRMPNGKTLPCFPAFDPNPRSSGYITDRFISGLRPQDFYFHCMAGREGLIDTAVKTARSGYLQRCLIKQLESLIVSYDMTVRDNDGSIVQFLYGEDSIDVTEMLYLNQFDFLEQNYAALLKKYSLGNMESSIDSSKVSEIRKSRREQKYDPQGHRIEYDPLISTHNPARYFGATSEKMYDELKKFCKKHKKNYEEDSIVKSKTKRIKSNTLEKLYFMKYQKSLAHPGENVGTIAGQGIGEPSTQMTLNTFHLAGHGGANVTLGIPRLREILMTASDNLKTPLMVLPLRTDKEFTDAEINMFANKFQKLQLSEVINNVKVTRDYILKGKNTVLTKYDLIFEFEDLEKIEETFSVTSTDLNKVFTNQFLPLLMKNITRQTKKGIEDTMIVKDSKTKHMQNKEMEEDEELLDQYKTVEDKNNFSGEESEIDQSVNADLEGVDGQKSKQDATQMGAYDEQDDAMSEESQSRSGHGFAEENMEIEELDDTVSQKTKVSKLDISSKINSFKPFLQQITFHEQEKSPEFKRAKIVIAIHLNLDVNKTKLNKILMLSLVEAILQKVLIRSVKGINKSYVIDRQVKGSKQKEKVIMTEGINFEECYNNGNIFDLNRVGTNNINEMNKHYGIEAARQCIVNEIINVFDPYGIDVDYRHLSLVADFMTQNGTYKPFNRIGMQDCNSTFLKASFETSTAFLSDACTKREFDDNTTPSSNLVLGQIPKIGTGAFDILQNYDAEQI